MNLAYLSIHSYHTYCLIIFLSQYSIPKNHFFSSKYIYAFCQPSVVTYTCQAHVYFRTIFRSKKTCQNINQSVLTRQTPLQITQTTFKRPRGRKTVYWVKTPPHRGRARGLAGLDSPSAGDRLNRNAWACCVYGAHTAYTLALCWALSAIGFTAGFLQQSVF